MNTNSWSSNLIVILSKFILGVVALVALLEVPIYSFRLFFWAIGMSIPTDADKPLMWMLGFLIICSSIALIALGAFLGHVLFEEICERFF